MLMFPTKTQIAIPTIDPSLFSGILQLVYHSTNTGLVLQEETDHTVPSWEAWIHITSKRRAVFSLYMLHWSYSVYHRLESFNCSELGLLPAPAAKFLWQARSADQWELLYKKWLVQWDGDEFMHYEFTHVKPGVMLDERTNRWLEDADELGILFSAICMWLGRLLTRANVWQSIPHSVSQSSHAAPAPVVQLSELWFVNQDCVGYVSPQLHSRLLISSSCLVTWVGNIIPTAASTAHGCLIVFRKTYLGDDRILLYLERLPFLRNLLRH